MLKDLFLQAALVMGQQFGPAAQPDSTHTVSNVRVYAVPSNAPANAPAAAQQPTPIPAPAIKGAADDKAKEAKPAAPAPAAAPVIVYCENGDCPEVKCRKSCDFTQLFRWKCKDLEEKPCKEKKKKACGQSKCSQEDPASKEENGDCEEKKEEDKGPERLFPDPILGFKLTGHVYGTLNYNATNTGNTRYNGPMTTNDQEGAYLNQFWLTLARELKEDELSVGARADAFFGNDYLSSLSRGFENARARGWLPKWWDNQDYGIAIPQAYVEVGTKKYNIKAGHFYTPHGYMVVDATGNFFNTLPWGFMMTNPFTHWGVQGNAALNDNISVMGAVVNGWDALDRPVNSAAYMGGIKYTFNDDKGYVSYNVISGQEPENRGPAYAARTLMTGVADFKFTEKLEFVLEGNYGWQRNRNIGTDDFYNIVPYLFYKVNCNLRAGLRYEYYYDPFGFTAAERVGNPNNGPIPANVVAGPYSGNFHTVAAGLNWAPNGSKNLMIRPEVRYDLFNGTGVGGQPFDAGRKDHQVMFVLGAYYQF